MLVWSNSELQHSLIKKLRVLNNLIAVFCYAFPSILLMNQYISTPMCCITFWTKFLVTLLFLIHLKEDVS